MYDRKLKVGWWGAMSVVITIAATVLFVSYSIARYVPDWRWVEVALLPIPVFTFW